MLSRRANSSWTGCYCDNENSTKKITCFCRYCTLVLFYSGPESGRRRRLPESCIEYRQSRRSQKSGCICRQSFLLFTKPGAPTLVPYVALSGSLDVANQSGALNKVGLDFSTYQQCANKVNPGKATVKQLAPVLKPVCGNLNMDCQMFEGTAADEVNEQLASEVPLLSLLPCSCAAATSGLGVEKIATLVNNAAPLLRK